MSAPPPFPRRSLLARWGIGAALVSAAIGVLVAWTGIGDWRPLCGFTNTCADSGSDSERPLELSPNSPVSVVWTGEGDRVEASWEQVVHEALDHYVVDIVALYPESFRIDAGYRLGQQTETSREVNPASDSVHWFQENGESLTLSAGQTWQLCATAYRQVPEGEDVSSYEIKGTQRCSDPFVLP